MAGIAILLDLWRKNQNFNSGLSSAYAFHSSASFSASSAAAAAASFAAGASFASRALFGYYFFTPLFQIFSSVFGDVFCFVLLKGVDMGHKI